MSWTYIPELDEYDKEITKDSSIPNRYTFNRYMYFKPDQYDNWSKGQNISSIPYTAEIVGNSNIPAPGVHLTGSLSAFYVNDVISIKNLSEEEHGDHCSYAVVTIEYENKRKSGSGSPVSYGQISDDLPPWERQVEDFTVNNEVITSPLIHGYLINGDTQSEGVYPIKTSAGQPIYGYNKEIYNQRITWTFYERGHLNTYVKGYPVINKTQVNIANVFIVNSGYGLLLPPNFKRLYYTDKKLGYDREPYTQWKFEILLTPGPFDGFWTPIINAGTKAIIDGELQDICSWYVYDPESEDDPIREYGSFKEMMEAKKLVDQFNKGEKDETKKMVWSGDFAQQPVPLTAEGEIYFEALHDPLLILSLKVAHYPRQVWNVGGRF